MLDSAGKRVAEQGQLQFLAERYVGRHQLILVFLDRRMCVCVCVCVNDLPRVAARQRGGLEDARGF